MCADLRFVFLRKNVLTCSFLTLGYEKLRKVILVTGEWYLGQHHTTTPTHLLKVLAVAEMELPDNQMIHIHNKSSLLLHTERGKHKVGLVWLP